MSIDVVSFGNAEIAQNSHYFRVRDIGAGNYTGFIIKGTGNVGIGTATPNYKLDVVGAVRAHEVLVNTQKTADFVFAPDYRLRPLTEVEQFITANKHLPDIAPADSMVQNGVSMGEMQIRLLQKIEELTLYVIEQEKKNTRLEEQVERQNKKIEMQQKEIDKLIN